MTSMIGPSGGTTQRAGIHARTHGKAVPPGGSGETVPGGHFAAEDADLGFSCPGRPGRVGRPGGPAPAAGALAHCPVRANRRSSSQQ